MNIIEQLQNTRVKQKKLSLGEIRWACRRGMLELDILLGDFFEQQYLSLNETDQDIFQYILSLPDQDLYEYFMGKRKPEDQELERVLKKICHTLAD